MCGVYTGGGIGGGGVGPGSRARRGGAQPPAADRPVLPPLPLPERPGGAAAWASGPPSMAGPEEAAPPEPSTRPPWGAVGRDLTLAAVAAASKALLTGLNRLQVRRLLRTEGPAPSWTAAGPTRPGLRAGPQQGRAAASGPGTQPGNGPAHRVQPHHVRRIMSGSADQRFDAGRSGGRVTGGLLQDDRRSGSVQCATALEVLPHRVSTRRRAVGAMRERNMLQERLPGVSALTSRLATATKHKHVPLESRMACWSIAAITKC